MERPLWSRIQELYHLTLPMPQSERGAYLAVACDKDQLLMREVASLLRADDMADGFLELPVFELGLKVISNSGQDYSSLSFAESGESLVATTIDGRYFVESKLSHGGIGKVYLARDVTLHNRRVVIKVLLEASLDDPYVVTKFRQEVEALSRIDHPNVVGVLGEGKLPNGKPYIAMQYVDGVTLRSRILSEGMDLERAASILSQIGGALDAVHQRSIFHRDLKPENILLQSLTGGKEWVKIVDFGIAKVKDSVVAPSTANKVPVGTVLYMSPEQLRGGEGLTSASDIYSMGVIAYEMITGRRPFNPTSAPQLLEMHREGVRINPIDLRPNLSTEARAILLRALSFDPAARYQNAAEFGDQLARALIDRGSIRSPHRPVPIAFSLTDRIPRYLIGALLIVLVGVGIAIYFYSNKGETRTSETPRNHAAVDPQPSPPTHSFNYWLDVQKMRGGKPYQDAFLSSGRDIFETGYKFRLNVMSSDGGFVYVFNDGPPTPAGTTFTLVYPTPSMQHAALGPNQLVKTGWNTFAGETGTENFWLVWSASAVPELESAKAEAFKHPEGGLTGERLAATRKFLMTKQDEVKTRYTTNNEIHQTTVRGNGDLLVRMVEFQHR
jgi:serine/threonine protein kinase